MEKAIFQQALNYLSDFPQSATSSLEYEPPVIQVIPYNPTWPAQFQQISLQLKQYLDLCSVQYLTIDHVGSTSVPGLAAKPIIDIIIEVPDAMNAEKAIEALTHEPPPEEYYKCIGDGGIRGRFSMKLHNRDAIPGRHVYIIDTQNPEGKVVMRCHRALRDTLKLPEHESLKLEYGQLKFDLAASSRDTVEYGQKKNPIIQRILGAAGWTEEQIEEKERLDYRISGDDDLPY